MLVVVASAAVAALALTLWRLWRRRETRKQVLLGASQVAAAAGIHPYKSAQQLYDEMTGAAAADEAGREAVAHGMEHERRAFALYQTLRMDGVRVEEGAGLRFQSAALPVAGYADGLVYRDEWLEGVLEIKCRFSRTDEAVPHQRLDDLFYHVPQCMCYLDMTGAAYCDLMSYTRRGSTVFRLRPDPRLLYLLRLAAERFCAAVARRQPPPPDPALAAQIRQLCLDCDWTSPQDEACLPFD